MTWWRGTEDGGDDRSCPTRHGLTNRKRENGKKEGAKNGMDKDGARSRSLRGRENERGLQRLFERHMRSRRGVVWGCGRSGGMDRPCHGRTRKGRQGTATGIGEERQDEMMEEEKRGMIQWTGVETNSRRVTSRHAGRQAGAQAPESASRSGSGWQERNEYVRLFPLG